jgi:hypothetical protein
VFCLVKLAKVSPSHLFNTNTIFTIENVFFSY